MKIHNADERPKTASGVGTVAFSLVDLGTGKTVASIVHQLVRSASRLQQETRR